MLLDVDGDSEQVEGGVNQVAAVPVYFRPIKLILSLKFKLRGTHAAGRCLASQLSTLFNVQRSAFLNSRLSWNIRTKRCRARATCFRAQESINDPEFHMVTPSPATIRAPIFAGPSSLSQYLLGALSPAFHHHGKGPTTPSTSGNDARHSRTRSRRDDPVLVSRHHVPWDHHPTHLNSHDSAYQRRTYSSTLSGSECAP